MSRSLLPCFALVALGAATAAAQVPAGAEFRANTFTTGNQWIYSMTPAAVDNRGNFVVVWESRFQEPDGSYGIYGQRYDAAGARSGGEFHVNQFTTDYQGEPSVVKLGQRGRFVVVWESDGPDGLGYSICARIFDGQGTAQTPEFLVNSYTPGGQYRPAVTAAPDGSFVVVWQSYSQDGSRFGIFGQRFGPSGQRTGTEFRVNTYTTSDQENASVAFTTSGQFVVTWSSTGQDGSGAGLFGQRYDAAGNQAGGEFQVNTYTTGAQGARAAVAAGAGDGFVVAWQAAGQDGNDYAVMARRFNALGAPLGGELLVNSYTTGSEALPHVASDAAGNFTVVWTQYPNQDGSSEGIFAQRFAGGGTRRGAEFRVNTFTYTNQDYGAVASDPAGNFVVAWSSRNQDGVASEAAMGQRFGGLLPAALAVDTSGNGVFEPGETADVRPSWRNVNGAAQTFAASLIGITGPPGASYSIPDSTGDYGTVSNGATQACIDCYTVSVSNPTPRPVLHWDATTVEAITPDAQGQRQPWRLHLGRSFADVPATNPFYRFVETLLHHGVTGGCSATAYCPSSATTRDQMAVFVLVAKEGAGYAPASCGAPVFADVPAGSPFCRWVEELARRGVVSGCGGGNYCPGDPVTREQMAVFVLRTLDPTLNPPACTTPVFGDVPASSPFCRWIEELARRGVVTGCGGGNYCPAGPVSREQMGVFIGATFGLTLYGP